MSQVFTYFIKISDEAADRYYIKTVINEQSNTIAMELTNLKTSWIGTLDENQIRNLAKKFPNESNDSFYSHTQRAFSQSNKNSKYIYTIKKIDKTRIDFIWKEKVDDLNILKTVGNIQLEEQINTEILEKIMDYTIDQIDILQTVNQQKNDDIQRLNTQLTKALQTIERTVDLKEQLETDLYKKFVLVLNTKKSELAKLQNQIEHSLFENDEQTISHKRRYHEDTSDEDEKDESQSKSKIFHHRQDSNSLELGNDEIDYRTSTIPKHHEKRKNEMNSIPTRSFVRHTSNASTIMPLPSLPDDSQTTDDMLEKI